jgi:dTDP-L-rhamnose 4-epimerase
LKVLVTGGAGFIGSYIVDELVKRGHDVRIMDSLESQVHGAEQRVPDYLNPEAEFFFGSVCDRKDLTKALHGVDVIFHQAALVGVGQSMYQMYRYMQVNTLGTALLLDVLSSEKRTLRKLIVASSMSVYGEGAYVCDQCGIVSPKLRPIGQLADKDWEMHCPYCNSSLMTLPTNEDKPLHPTSIYAISKRDQEEMCLNVGKAYGLPTVALRYFNVYGARQALSNPYTGVAAIFSSRLLNHRPPLVFEDGLQSRDFVHVNDIVQANMLAMEKEEANYGVFNVGTGRQLTILDMGRVLAKKLEYDGEPEIVHRFREGDVRHCFADISKISTKLGFRPQVRFEDGIEDLVSWVKQQVAEDKVESALTELESRGLVK